MTVQPARSASFRRTSQADRLPDFPWDLLTGAKQLAQSHPDGIVDLSVGTPVDPVDPLIQRALASVAEVPGYPTTHGTAELRAAASAAMERRFAVPGVAESAILPVIGTKEAVAGLPSTLGIGPGQTVVIPEVAYPTYRVGAVLAGADVVAADSLTQLGPQSPALLYINSPSNPTGKVLGLDHLRKVVQWARERGTIVVSDECYLGLCWDEQAYSILDPRVCDGDMTGLLAVHSLSKTSNLASYRAGFITGDADLVTELLAVRKHAGLMLPLPIQAAMTAALSSDEHETVQRERYRGRREKLKAAIESVGFRVDESAAGLYLWSTSIDPRWGQTCWETVDKLSELGILAAPGDFYGPAGANHVRIALTATDERIDAAVRRLTA